MRVSICCMALLMSTTGMAAGEVAAAENNSSLATLTLGFVSPVVAAGQQGEEVGWGQKARPDPEADIPAQEPPLMVAEASVLQSNTQQFDRIIGICHLSENPYDPTSAVNAMNPPLAVKNYFRVQEHYKIEGTANVSVSQMPAHGTLDGPVNGYFAYYPEKGYLGNDRASLLVEMGGKKVRVEYFFRVLQQVPDQEGVDAYADYCPNKVRVWKISSTTDTNGNTILAAVDYQSLAAKNNWGQTELTRIKRTLQ